MSKTIKVLSFDLDDTLWPCAPTILRAEKLLYQWLADHVPIITESYDIHQLREKRHALFYYHPELKHDLTKLRIKSFEVLTKEFNLERGWIQPAFEIFYEARQQVTLFDDVKPTLNELTKKFQLVSLTNGNADPIKTGIDHWFDLSLNSALIGKLKSEPEIYLQAQKLTNVDASQMVHIGDDPMNDVSGAKLAGASAIWLNRDKKPWAHDACQPDAIITSLHELSAAIDKL